MERKRNQFQRQLKVLSSSLFLFEVRKLKSQYPFIYSKVAILGCQTSFHPAVSVAPEVHFRFPGYYSRIYLMYSQELYKVLRRASSTHSKNNLCELSELYIYPREKGRRHLKITQMNYCTLPEVFPLYLFY
jgi:hypothetical protein